MSISDDLKNKSDDELAQFQADMRGRVEYEILIERDWERRARIKQHELDIELMCKQVRSMRFAAILGVIATLVGAIIGACLQYKLSQQPIGNTRPIVQQEILPSSAVDRPIETVLPNQIKETDRAISSSPPKVKNK